VLAARLKLSMAVIGSALGRPSATTGLPGRASWAPAVNTGAGAGRGPSLDGRPKDYVCGRFSARLVRYVAAAALGDVREAAKDWRTYSSDLTGDRDVRCAAASHDVPGGGAAIFMRSVSKCQLGRWPRMARRNAFDAYSVMFMPMHESRRGPGVMFAPAPGVLWRRNSHPDGAREREKKPHQGMSMWYSWERRTAP
jgi:hypothetical protein